jgi:hypothetical protein
MVLVTTHSGLAHLAQLTTIYMRGLLGAKYLFTCNQVRNMVSKPWIRVRVRFNYVFNLPPNPDPIFFTPVAASGFPAAIPRGVCGPPCGVLLTARPSRVSSSWRHLLTRPSSGRGLQPRVLFTVRLPRAFSVRMRPRRGLLSRASLVMYSLGAALLPLLLQSGRCCALVLVGVVVSFWSRSCCSLFFFTETSGKVLPW